MSHVFRSRLASECNSRLSLSRQQSINPAGLTYKLQQGQLGAVGRSCEIQNLRTRALASTIVEDMCVFDNTWYADSVTT